MKYLIFGGTGSLGKKLIRRLAVENQVSVYSRDEAKHWTIKNELTEYELGKLRFYVGDIRDYKRVREVIRQERPTVIIVAAALKQVDTCELSPSESILTNLIGTQNVINAVNDLDTIHVEKVLFVSTDKACSPVNVYGMCKAISERVVTSEAARSLRFIPLCTRYGNVLESRGSIIPLFKWQAENADALTVTDPEMTRFVMTLDDSVDLIDHALKNGKAGETWIPILPAMRIGDLAEIFSEISKKPIKIVGLRPGEKMHEDLINESESVRAYSTDTHHVIRPAYSKATGKAFTYTSADSVLTKSQLREHLIKLGIFDMPLDQFDGQKIEEINTSKK